MTPSPSRPRVLFLGHGAERTGPPQHLSHLLGWLREERDVEPAVVVARGGELVGNYRSRGAEVTVAMRRREPLEPLPSALRRARAPGAATAVAARALRARLARTDPGDLVYLNTVSAPTLALLDAVPLRATPLLVHVHELEIGLSALPAHDVARLLTRADAILAASHAVADNLVARREVGRDGITVAHELVDVSGVRRSTRQADRNGLRRAIGAGPSSMVVGSVGLPDWRKAPEHLLAAVWRLRQSCPGLDLRIVWIGGHATSPDGRRLADEARRLDLGDRLHHVDHLADPADYLAALDVFVLPSREDAFPLAVLEAAAAGLPVVSFASGGVGEVVDDEVGRIVTYPDVAAMSCCLEELAEDSALRSRLGAAGAARVAARHDVSVGAPRIWAAAECLLGQSS